MKWPGKDEDDDSFHAQPRTEPKSAKLARYVVAGLAAIYLAGIMFGGPCSRPDSHPEAAGCTADTVVEGKKVDGTDMPLLDWTKWLQSPNGLHNGFLIAALGFWAIQSSIWLIGYERYYARKLVTPEGAWAFDPARHLQVLPGGRIALGRLGGVDGNRYIPANEGVVIFPLVASRTHGRNTILYARSLTKDRDTLPELAAYAIEKQAIEGPYREAVSPEDIEPTDHEVIKKVMDDMRDNLVMNHANQRLQMIARTDKVALDHIHHAQKRGFVPGRDKQKTVIVNGNGKHVGEDEP